MYLCLRSLGQKVLVLSGYDVKHKRLSSFGLPAKEKKINGAFYDEHTGKILFFVDKSYYRYVSVLLFKRNNKRRQDDFTLTNENIFEISYDSNKKKMDKGYPKLVDERFPQVSGKVSAAFQYKG